jgi:hypothetical protein
MATQAVKKTAAVEPSADAPREKKQRHRSPAYPFISLKKAVDRAKEFYAAERKHTARIPVAVTHWKFAKKSSGGLQTIGALKQFGLMEDVGSGDNRQVKLTDAAIRIIADERPQSPERDQLIKTAALQPKIHGELFRKWGVELPSQETMRTFLKIEKEFNEAALDDFIKQYKDTIGYAKLAPDDTIPQATDEGSDKDESGEGGDMEIVDLASKGRASGQNPPPPSEGVLTLSVPYRGVNLSVRVQVHGQNLTRDHIAKVRRYLELAEEDLDAAETREE